MNRKMKEACAAVADCFEANPECWTHGWFGRTKNGIGTTATDPRADSWCAIGGVMAAMKTDDFFIVGAELKPFARMLGYDRAGQANNVGGRKVAVKMLRMAAES